MSGSLASWSKAQHAERQTPVAVPELDQGPLTTHIAIPAGPPVGARSFGAGPGVEANWPTSWPPGLCGPVGVGVGALIRNQVAALVGVLVWVLVVEGCSSPC